MCQYQYICVHPSSDLTLGYIYSLIYYAAMPWRRRGTSSNTIVSGMDCTHSLHYAPARNVVLCRQTQLKCTLLFINVKLLWLIIPSSTILVINWFKSLLLRRLRSSLLSIIFATFRCCCRIPRCCRAGFIINIVSYRHFRCIIIII